MRFVLTIKLGNDAMQTQRDIAECIATVVRAFRNGDPDSARFPEIGDGCAVRDVNGNVVGGWHMDGGDQ